jgi:hypothetical protein
MALPRYQNIGVQAGGSIDSLPRIDFPNRGEATRGLDAISNALDVMSGAFFKEAQIAATEEGERYGAQNAPTQEQIKLAIESGEPIPQVGDSRTFFGRAASRAYSDIVSTQFTYLARADMDKIKSDASNGVISPTQVIPAVNSVINGYRGALSQVDPALARKLEAQLAYDGNNVFLAASRRAASRVSGELAIEIRDTIMDLEANLESTVIPAGPTVDPETGKVISVKDKIAIQRQLVENIARRTNKPSFVERTLKNFDRKANKALGSYVADWASDPNGDPVARVHELETGKINDPAIADIWKNTTPSERIDIYSKSADFVSKREAFNDRMAVIRQKGLDRTARAFEDQYSEAWMNDDQASMETAVNNLMLVDPKKAATLKRRMIKESSVDDPDVVKGLTLSYSEGTLTRERIDNALDQDLISAKTAKSWIDTLKREDNKNFKSAVEFLKQHPKIDYYGPFPDVGKKNLAKATNQLRTVIEANPTANVMEEAKKIVSETTQTTEQDYLSGAQRTLNGLATRLGVQAKDGAYSIEQFDRMLRANTNTLRPDEMQAAVNAIKAIRGAIDSKRPVEGFRK